MNNSEQTSTKAMDIVNKGLAKRYNAEKRFRFYGLFAIILSMAFLSILFISIIANGYTAFQQTFIQLEVFLDPAKIDKEDLAGANYLGLVRDSLKTDFPDVKKRKDKRKLFGMVSNAAAFKLRDFVEKNRHTIGTTIQIWVPADDDVDMLMKGHIDRDVPQSERRMSDMQISWVDTLQAKGRLEKRFNKAFFLSGDSGNLNWPVSWGLCPDHFTRLSSPCCSLFPSGWLRPSIWRSLPPQTGGPTS